MGTPRGFEKHLSGLISPLFLPRNFRDYRTLQHIGEDETGMMMRLTDSSGSVIDIADGYLPVFHCDVRQVVCEDRTGGSWGLLSRYSVSGLGICSAQFA